MMIDVRKFEPVMLILLTFQALVGWAILLIWGFQLASVSSNVHREINRLEENLDMVADHTNDFRMQVSTDRGTLTTSILSHTREIQKLESEINDIKNQLKDRPIKD